MSNGADVNLERVLARGTWTPVERFGIAQGWRAAASEADGFDVQFSGEPQGRVRWDLLGEHNIANALAAIAAARHAGVPSKSGIEALAQFRNVKRRMEIRGVVNGVTIYDDFAHHPTAIATTLAGLRKKAGAARIFAVLEPRSNTMKLGVMKDALAASLNAADRVYCYSGGLGWSPADALASLGAKASVCDDLSRLVEDIAAATRAGDHVLIMSNGGFGGIHDKLLSRLAARSP